MKKYFTCRILLGSLCAVLSAAVMCGCESNDEEAATETEVSASETTTYDGKYALVRGWTADELLEGIFFCGEYHSFPANINDDADISYSDGKAVFSDGSYAAVTTDNEGGILSIEFTRGAAPEDLSVIGIGFDSVPDDIPSKIGIAESVWGDKENITYSFRDGGIRELRFSYAENKLDSIYIAF